MTAAGCIAGETRPAISCAWTDSALRGRLGGMHEQDPPMDPQDAAAEAASCMAFALARILATLLQAQRLSADEARELLERERIIPPTTRMHAALNAMLDGAWQAIAANGPAPPA